MFEIIKKYNFWDNKQIKTGFFREMYVKRISKYIGNSLIKVILGQRRVGKSYLMRMIIDNLIKQKNIPKENILYINKDIHELDFINNCQIFQELLNYYRKICKPNGKVYIFLDEVQEIQNWEKLVNSLSQNYTNEYEIFITGSNANLLSTELSTYLSGRYISFEIFPFSYSEYLFIKGLKRSKKTLIEYLKEGGLSEIYNLKDNEIKTNYISNLRDSIILRDIVQRYNLRDVYLLEKLIDFIIDSIGSFFSIQSIVKYLKRSGYNTNNETLGNYINYLINSFFIFESKRYDIKRKKILSGEKNII